MFFCLRHKHLDGAIDLGVASDQRIDFAVLGLLVEIDAIGLERIALLLRLVATFGVGFFLDAAHGPRFRQARPLGDAMADVIDRVIARHVLLLQEIGGMTLALGENRHQHICAGHFLASRGLHVNDRALDHALEPCGRLGILSAIGDQIFEFGFEVRRQAAPKLVEIDIAGAHHRGSVLIVDQRQQQMLKRCVLVMPFVGNCKRAVKRLFETSGESWHSNLPVHVAFTPPTSLFFHHALQRMLMFARKVHHLCDLRLRHLVRIDPAFAYSVVMHMQHNSCGGFVILAEEPLQHMHNELHGCVVVIENEYAVHVRPLGLRLGLGDDPGGRPALVAPALAVVVSHPWRIDPRGGQDLTGLGGWGRHGWTAASYVPGGCTMAAPARGQAL